MKEGSGAGSGSISLTIGFGSGIPKNIWILRIRIRNTGIFSIKLPYSYSTIMQGAFYFLWWRVALFFVWAGVVHIIFLKLMYGLQQAFFIERDPHSYTRHIERVTRGERDIVPSTQDWGHADVAWGKCASQARQAGVTLSWRPPPPFQYL